METKMVVKKLLVFLLFLLLINVASAQPLKLSTEKTLYRLGEQILVYATIENIKDIPTVAILDFSLENVKETYPTAPIHFEYELMSKEKREVLLYNLTIDDTFDSDTYIVNARFFYENIEIMGEDLQFDIIEIPEELFFEVKTCEEYSCPKEKKVFVQDKRVYLKYNSGIGDLTVTVLLTYPDKTTKELTLPASIRAGQIGAYELEVTATKLGYKTSTKREQFAVIGEEPDISFASEVKGPEGKSNLVLIISIILIVLVGAIYLIVLEVKKSKNTPFLK